jgi:DNA-binding MarR family transcriptional regulator
MNMNSDANDPNLSSATTSAAAVTDFSSEPSRLLLTVGEPTRWLVLRELLRGKPLSVQELARRAGCRANQMSKHLAVLSKLGVVTLVPSPDGDGRKQCFVVPEIFRRTDRAGRLMLDFGVCLLRFGDDVRETVSSAAKDRIRS